jgi:hypothetical protein
MAIAEHILAEYSSSELRKLYSWSLAEPEEGTEVSEDNDLIVYGNREVTVTVQSGATYKLRDLVIFGRLTITTDTEDGPIGRLKVRKTIVTGDFIRQRIDFFTRDFSQFPDDLSFQEKISELLNNAPTGFA